MRAIVLLALFLGFASVHADLNHCSKDILANANARRAVELLQAVSGRYSLGSCLIELRVCGDDQGVLGDPIVGDLLVTDSVGREFYVLLDFDLRETARTSHHVVAGRRQAHYESIERIADSLNGRTEAYRLEVTRTKDLSQPRKLVLGYYTSKLKNELPFLAAKKSYWVHCGN